jgi:dipeptidase E
MKLLLTSAGIANKSIEGAFLKLLGKPFSETKIAFIPTASNVEAGDKWWLIDDLINLKNLGLLEIDIVDFSAMPLEMAKERLSDADVLYFGGGNTFHLMYWINKLNLRPFFEELLKTRIWVGTSAGSVIAGVGLVDDEEREFVESMGESVGTEGLGFVDFSLEPHYQSPLFEGRDESYASKVAEQFSETFYVIDDSTAIAVDGEEIEILSEGSWKKF